MNKKKRDRLIVAMAALAPKALGFEPLQRLLPAMPETPWTDDEGETCYAGFQGDISLCPQYVTDGRLMLLASAIDPAVTIWREEGSWGAKYTNPDSCEKVWKAAEERTAVSAVFLGCGELAAAGLFAFVRDTRGWLMVLNAHLLAFAVHALHPDALTVDGDTACPDSIDGGYVVFGTPVALHRDGRIVGLLMPMRHPRSAYPTYDLEGAPAIPLALEARA